MAEKTRILYVDDNPLDRALVRDSLEHGHSGFSLTEAESQSDFEKHMTVFEFDIVLTDFNILGFEGLKVLEKVKEKFPDVPVIIVTGTGSESIAVKSLKSGAADYVIKTPQHIKRLPKTIMSALKDKENQQAYNKLMAELQEREESYRTLFEAMDQGVVYQNASGEITSANPAALRILGLSLDQMLGRTSIDPRWKAVDENHITLPGDKHPAMVALTTGRPIKDFLMGVFNPQLESYVWIIVNSVPLFTRGMDRPIKVFSTFLDITERKKAEDDLKASNYLLDLWMSNSPPVAFMKDLKGRITFVNRSFEKLFGLKPGEIVGKTDYDLYADSKAIAARMRANDKTVVDSGKVKRFEEKISAKGIIKHFETIKFPLRNEAGVVSGIAGMATDVTNRKRMEEALKESEKRFRSYINMAPDGVFILDDQGSFQEVNKAAAKITGYSKKRLLSLSFADLLPPASLESGKKHFSRAKKTGTYSSEFQFRKKNGEIRWWSMDSVRLGVNSIIGFCKDITERKLVEEKLDYQASLIDNVSDAVISTDNKFNILSWNRAAQQMYGWKKNEAIGKNIRDIIPVQYIGTDEAEVLAEFEKNNTWIGEVIQQNKKGDKLIILASVTAIRDNNRNLTGAVAVNTNISELRKTEDARHESERKLQVSRERFDLAMKAAQDGLFDWNLVTNEIYFSPGWKSMLGYKYDELPNDFSVWANLTKPADVKKSWRMQKELINKQRDRFEIEFQMKHKDGHWVDILSRANAIFDENDQAVRIVGTHVDISDYKKAQAKIDKELKEKKVLLRELYHRTKNNLQVTAAMMDIKARSLDDPEVKEAFESIEKKILGMALVHQQLYESGDLSNLNLYVYIQRLINIHMLNLDDSYNHISFSLKGDKLLVSLDTAMPCGIIINELITNAYKHAFPDKKKGRIDVKLQADKDMNIVLEIADNGVGLPENFNQDKIIGTGIQLVTDIVKYQLGGALSITSSQGTHWRIKFNLDYSESKPEELKS